MLGIKSHHLVQRVGGRNYTLREEISPQWENWWKTLCECVRECTRGMCATVWIFANMHEWIAFQWFLHSRHSFLWISRQHEAHCSTALTSHRGFHCLLHSFSRSLTIPPIFGSERKGIPDDDSKTCAALGNSLHIYLHPCAHLLRGHQRVHHILHVKMEFSSALNSKW